jgi:serine phosphatase RsbU (regulator of sigma subunit)
MLLAGWNSIGFCSVEQLPPIAAVDVLAAELRRALDASSVGLLITNFIGDAVVRLSYVTTDQSETDGENERSESLPLRGSVYEQVLFSQVPVVVPDGDAWLVLVPITERGDAIGILELCLVDHPDAETVDDLTSAGHALAYVLIASRRHTDLFEWGQRTVPFTLAAEIQRRLLPTSYTVEGGAFTIAGWLEPVSSVGGDTFDYSVEREYLYASITDAMGHSTQAALLATLTLASLRNSRRQSASPAEQATAANQALLVDSLPDQFVTGQVLRVRMADGSVEFVNAGHPAPYRVRAGEAAQVDVAVQPALGIVDVCYETEQLRLEPNDRLVLVTDGFLERNAAAADLPKILTATADRHPREVVRELATNVLGISGGELHDDAAVLCLDWYGPDALRNANGGASQARTTDT